VREQTKDIAKFITYNVREHPRDIAKLVSEEYGISRQAVGRHIQALVKSGVLRAHGNTKARAYELVPLVQNTFTYNLRDSLEEHILWRDILPIINEYNPPTNIREICEYGFSEMVNNSVDHSDGSILEVKLELDLDQIFIAIADDGIGIFNKIQRELNLDDKLHAVFELTKGKLTTDPENHTGEGIFFTSRAFDEFRILSGNIFFSHNPLDRDWVMESRSELNTGTVIHLIIKKFSSTNLRKIFKEFTSDDNFGFSKTIVPVSLSRYGKENLISRSQARRILLRFEKFSEIILDFVDVDVIGQAFADEIFRVFERNHPEIQLIPMRTNQYVLDMINRARGRE